MSHRRSGTCFTVFLPLLIVLCGPIAHAQSGSKAARPFYDKGVMEYTLGHFPEAIAQFEKAYEIDPAPILLFNIAQAHRHSGDIDRAIFFYRRYLEQAPSTAANRPDVEKRIKDLEELRQKSPDLKATSIISGGRQHSGGSPAAAAGSSQPGGGIAPGVVPHPIFVGTDVGPSFPAFTVRGADVDRPVLVAIRVFGARAFGVGRGAVDVGAAGTFAPMRYDTAAASGRRWSMFWGVLA